MRAARGKNWNSLDYKKIAIWELQKKCAICVKCDILNGTHATLLTHVRTLF